MVLDGSGRELIIKPTKRVLVSKYYQRGVLHPVGFWIPTGGGGIIHLSGTLVSPNYDIDTFDGPFGAAVAGWAFTTTGIVAGIAGGQFQDGIEWTEEQDSPTGDYWLYADLQTGSTPSGTLDTWLKIAGSSSSTASFSWTRSGTNGTTAGTLRIRISDDSGGSNILATGYYRGEATVTGN